MGKTLLVLSVFSVWCFVCQQWYVCGIKQACASAIGQSKRSPTTTTSTPSTKTISNLPIAFRWQSSEPILGVNYTKYRDSIIRELGDEDILQITALYDHTEDKLICTDRASQIDIQMVTIHLCKFNRFKAKIPVSK